MVMASGTDMAVESSSVFAVYILAISMEAEMLRRSRGTAMYLSINRTEAQGEKRLRESRRMPPCRSRPSR